ncbi:hypothetical protein CAEBREN_25467 [Caenorhabditis brenneri]|uniref:DNA-directed DNA polymerase n=1 Tax=Caenorhabditis brenneri TaxID=135651 RepID=G0MPD6_CAEBE|nr:hypothetical protein CAEBREN_25467 [Caenorhabditis brenneri]
MLLQNSFISIDDDLEFSFSPTQLGRAAIASSLPPEASLAIFDDLNLASRAIALDTELHMLYLVTPINVTVWQECDWHHLFSLFSKLPPDQRRIAKLVGASEKFILDQLQGRRNNEKQLQVHIRFFSALALFDLINEMSIYEVSHKYRIPRGCLQTLQSQSATYAAMIVAFCLRLGWTYLKALLDGFAMRLLFGVRSELSELVAIEGIDGQRTARILHERGVTCLSHLSACESSKLAHLLTLAVPYSRSNSNDGLGEWLFGEPRMRVGEAARLLKERARAALLRRVQELGIAVELPEVKMEVKEEVEEEEKEVEKENIPESCDSGLPDSCMEEMDVEEEEDVKDIKDIKSLDEMTRSVTELSLTDNTVSNEDLFKIDGNDPEDDEEIVEETVIECLETSLLRMKPPKDEVFLRRLSQTFSPAAHRRKSLLNGSSFLEDSFDRPVPGSVPLSFRTPNRNDSNCEDSFDRPVPGSVPIGFSKLPLPPRSQNNSFDVFVTPPSKEEKSRIAGKHARIAVDSPLAFSPILKHAKLDPNKLRVEDVCYDLTVWRNWMKTVASTSSCSLCVLETGVAIRTDASTTFIPLVESFDGVTSPDLKFFDSFSKCVIPLRTRLECLKLLTESTESVFVMTMQDAFRLFEQFNIKISRVKVIRIAAHLNSLIDCESDHPEELFPMLLNRFPDLEIRCAYSNSSGFFKSAVEAFAMKHFYEKLSHENFHLETQACQTVLNIFYKGISFDQESCNTFISNIRQRLETLEEQIWRLAHGKFNIDSSNEVSNVIFHRLSLVYPETSGCKVKQRHLPTNKLILEQMINQHQIVGMILEYRHIQHTLTQCLLPLAKYNERIHCRMETCTATGRILTSVPNLQNVPKKVSSDGISARQLFTSSPGNLLIGADYKQLELRVLAHLCNDSTLVTMIKEDRDLFGELSFEWNFSRDVVKQLCYGLIYGMGARTLAELTRVKVEEAEKMMNSFFAMFPGVRSYINETKDKVAREEHIETILGRKKLIKGGMIGEERARSERVAVNYTIQGTASEIFKCAIVDIESKIKEYGAHIVLTIHDEMFTFCIRNFICEHSQEVPGPMDNLHSFKKNKIPVFHIYGVTDSGQKACLHVHGVLPYLVLRVGGKATPFVLTAMRAKVNRGIEKEIEMSSGGKNNRYTPDYVYKMEQFSSRSLYGYQDEEEDFVRVYFSSPWYLQKAVHSLGKEVIDKPLFQPFEAHVPFHLQFFIDNSIFGMDNIHLKRVKFRIDPGDQNDEIVYKDLTVGDVRQNEQLLSPYERITNCPLECDALVTDILNMQMQADNVHSSNPGLEYIWREEKERCDAAGIELKDVFNSYEPRKSTIWPQEREMLRTARKYAKRLREERNMSEQLDDLMTTRFIETQPSTSSAAADMTIWESQDPEEFNPAAKKKSKREKTPEELDDERQKEEDREDVPEDDDNDPRNQEAEMTMITDSQKQKEGEDDVMEVDEVEEEEPEEKKEKEKDPDKTIEDVVDVSSGEETNDEVIDWITTKSSFEQDFLSMNESLVDPKKPAPARPQFSREMTACSEMSDETVVAPAEHSQALEQTKFLSQTSIDEPSTSEMSGESDIVGLCVASLELLVDTKMSMPNFVVHPIVSVSLAIYDDVCRDSCPKVHVLLTTIPNQCSHFDKRVIYCESELEMLEEVVKVIVKCDVDVLVGYETVRLSWGYFLRRIKVLGSELSMDRSRTELYEDQKPEEEVLIKPPKGRLLVSVWKVVRSDLKLRNYDLGSAVGNVLRRKLPMLENSAMMRRIRGGSSTVR